MNGFDNVKKILLGICSIVLGLSLVSCNTSENYKLKSASAANEISNKNVSESDINKFIDKLDLFSAKLTVSLYKNSDKNTNICISPISVYMALAMAIECANGETKEEMLNAVGVTYEEVLNFTEHLYSNCNREYKRELLTGNKKIMGYQRLANSIWIDNNAKLNEEVLDVLATRYKVDSFHVPFYDKNRNANKALSDYVKEKTNGLIDNDFDLPVETIFALVNTLCIKDVWNEDGDDLSFTSDKYQFKEYNGEIVKTKLLSGYYNLGRKYESESYTHFYTKTDHNMTIKFIVPKDGYTIDDVFTVETLSNINTLESYNEYDHENKLEYHTRCYFPEFKASYNNDIKNVLINDFGIKSLFNDSCDFTKISEDVAYCGAVIHQTELKVDKTGIEGAAVTIMLMCGTAGPSGYTLVYEDYIVDKAFGYIICNSYGIQLFSGVICNI